MKAMRSDELRTEQRYVVVSSDCHAGLPWKDYGPYLDPQYRDEFDSWVAKMETTPLVVGGSKLDLRGKKIWDSLAAEEAVKAGGHTAPGTRISASGSWTGKA